MYLCMYVFVSLYVCRYVYTYVCVILCVWFGNEEEACHGGHDCGMAYSLSKLSGCTVCGRKRKRSNVPVVKVHDHVGTVHCMNSYYERALGRAGSHILAAATPI